MLLVLGNVVISKIFLRTRKIMAPPSSWHTYSSVMLLGLRSSKAPGREFRQHDGVVTILMFYYRRASPKHCNNTTEVEYGGGGKGRGGGAPPPFPCPIRTRRGRGARPLPSPFSLL